MMLAGALAPVARPASLVRPSETTSALVQLDPSVYGPEDPPTADPAGTSVALAQSQQSKCSRLAANSSTSSGSSWARPVTMPAQLVGLVHRHPHFWTPVLAGNTTAETVRAGVRASQQPATCRRYMLLQDDSKAGLGYDGHLIALVLSLAMRENRVLLEIEHPNRHWCARPPYTLQCLYEPWTHCPMPDLKLAVPHSLGHTDSADIVTIGTEAFYQSNMWYGTGNMLANSVTLHALEAHLFRPRPWVVEMAGCYLDECGVGFGEYISVHVRESPEKAKEVGQLPTFDEYVDATLQELRRHRDLRVVQLQTANPQSLNRFVEIARQKAFRVCFTDNRREVDETNKFSTSSVDAPALSTNALLAANAAAFISPVDSAWTPFVQALMHTSGAGTLPEIDFYSGRTSRRKLAIARPSKGGLGLRLANQGS